MTADPTIVDARFAGGGIFVNASTFVDRPVVRLELPGANPVPLFPDEARALATALLAHADHITEARAALVHKNATALLEQDGREVTPKGNPL